MTHQKCKKISLLATLITLLTFFNVALSNDLIKSIDERLLSAMRIGKDDTISMEIQVKSSVPESELQHALKCVHEGESTYLTPLYIAELNKSFSSNDKIKALSFYESIAWEKALEIQLNYLLPILGIKVNSAATTLSLSPNEEQEIKQFVSSDLGKKSFTFAMSLIENDMRIMQINKIKESCIAASSLTRR